MRRKSWLTAVLVALTLALTPAIADARAGSGSSIGSRGSNTFSAPPSTSSGSAMPFQRSMTQPSAPAFGTPGFGQPAYQRSGSPFMSGLFGGLIGAGIGGLLFGHGMFGGIGSFGGFLGFLIQIALVVMLVRFLWRRFMRPQPALAGLGAMPRTGMQPPMGGVMGGGAAPGGKQRLAIGPQDFQTFEQLLRNIQAAWTAHDLSSLGRMVTPEMLSYFGEQLADQTSRGVRNSVTDVRLEKGDLSESWSERGHDYATVSMRFSMLDVTRDAMGRVVDGDAATRTIATEFWTFMRANGGVWVLSAIQQAR